MTLRRCTLLIVEDNSAFRQRIIRSYLSRCRVVELPKADHFTEVLDSERFHCILMDYELPGGRGDTLVTSARSSGYQGAIVGISSSEYLNRKLLQAGADAAVEKRHAYQLPGVIRHALSIAEERIGRRECDFPGE